MDRFLIGQGLPFGLCVVLLILPLPVVLSWATAVLVHEMGHWLALRLLRVPIYRIRIGLLGAELYTGPMSPLKTALCALAGPFAGMLLLLIAKYFPMTALFGLIHSLVNLIPMLPLDGGRIVHGLFYKLPGLVRAVENGALILVVGILFYLLLRSVLGIIPFLILIFLLIRRKLSCKGDSQRVQ